MRVASGGLRAVRAAILTVRGAGSIQEVLRATLRALAYLLTGPVAGAAGLLWSLAATATVAVLSITQLGGPVFLAASWATRRLAGLERHRAGWQLGAPIETPYVPVTGDTIRRRVTAVAAQPATWRDLAWLVVLFPIGLAGGIAAAVTTAVDLGAITAPLWLWAVPNPRAPFPADPLMTTTAGRLALVPIGLLLLPAVAWLLRRLAQPKPEPPKRSSRPEPTGASSTRRPASPKPAARSSTPRPQNSAGSNETSTTAPKPASSPPA